MEENDLEIKTSLLTLEGINEVILNTEIFRGNLQYTDQIVSLEDIEHKEIQDSMLSQRDV
jgi:TRAP-type mannitol/chloroaromatic compound transport system permease small subunit